ncbi:DUF86 domain-containing protein [Candidatus Woesearchaeota archaeon]|nr:MAG: hypothetical protein QS99_C0008G0054 [archaeon GW2011_AR4]MBS3129698.1 DUF86 domain-containing protein [Candidatus Woesearchaeota archaeon]HIH38802.1 DUF86 domain-containing protein [Candidatus Woesearchaeota archaeon]HIH49217.1 DUF86 domain-containing protein [Candidatus Woesearchaeota archaeon]HIJ03360.1 DUF86 domain-containing protein [Candidatus Woesearchaeota archaeon]
MRDSCRKILEYTKGFDKDSFVKNQLVVDGTVRNLEIIGEAAKHLSPEAKVPAIDWRKISGLRDILIHAYFGINQEIIWDIVENKIPELLSYLEK